MKLVIVESPAKAKTIGRFLGPGYKIEASLGHVRDLPSSAAEIPEKYRKEPWARLGVDVEHDFWPLYVVQKDSKKKLTELKKLCKEAEEVILATDEDREGESISWHLLQELKPRVPVSRIAFHEITREAIQEALANPRSINDSLVRAQEARRILDRLFGYELSPVLWRKVKSNLSAGRVQSVAVLLVVEREEDRRAFRRAEYWDLEATLAAADREFKAQLVQVGGQRVAQGKDFGPATGQLKNGGTERIVWLDETEARRLADSLNTPECRWTVIRVEEKETRSRPNPPFTTSTLQQAASSAYGMSPQRTMRIAQQLYEGIDMGGGEREGLITYMRTDSVTLSERALREASAIIRRLFGPEYHERRQYETRSKLAQEAHEAIRPTRFDRTPDEVAPYLDAEQLKLYQLIWARAMASQMADAVLLKTTMDLEALADGQDCVFRAQGTVVKFPGYLRLMDNLQKESILPPLREGMSSDNGGLRVRNVEAERHETQPPARYTEASLVRQLEEAGIGRPSTYAPTVQTIQERGYVERVGQTLAPTYLGIAVTLLLRKHFPEYVNVGFTAEMEDVLDDIANGRRDWVTFLRLFYFGDNNKQLGLLPKIQRELEKIDYPAIPVGLDPQTGEPIEVRLGRQTPYIRRGKGGEGNIAFLPPGLYYDELTVEKAQELLAAHGSRGRELGKDPVTGLTVLALQGRYGPYVQLGDSEKGEESRKRASLPRGMNLDDLTLEKALWILSLPRVLGVHPQKGAEVVVNIGRFGPYVGCDGEFRSIPAGRDIFSVTLEDALAWLSQPKRTAGKRLLRNLGNHPVSGVPVDLYEGRYGPYVTDGSTNASLPKGFSVETVTLDSAVELLNKAAARPAKRPRKAAATKRRASGK
ncbi:MAG TPA: type I DNA topoisomerase [Candidatus Hydrogenedentes bacterium]|nr:type I DNA topoisomerase [Candidatus Hydrogenedentota bacterium]